MDDLTNNQKFVLTSMYKYFLELQPGLPPEKAKCVGDSNYVQENLASQFSKEYVSDICWELESKEYIFCSPGDNLANDIVLADKTIIYMESSFKRNIASISSFLSAIMPFLNKI